MDDRFGTSLVLGQHFLAGRRIIVNVAEWRSLVLGWSAASSVSLMFALPAGALEVVHWVMLHIFHAALLSVVLSWLMVLKCDGRGDQVQHHLPSVLVTLCSFEAMGQEEATCSECGWLRTLLQQSWN